MIDDDAIADSVPFYDRAGRLIDRQTLDLLLSDHKYCLVAHDLVGGLLVGTAWLGVDYSFGRGDRRMIFETVVLAPDGGRLETALSGSEEEALEAHRFLVQEYTFETYGVG